MKKQIILALALVTMAAAADATSVDTSQPGGYDPTGGVTTTVCRPVGNTVVCTTR